VHVMGGSDVEWIQDAQGCDHTSRSGLDEIVRDDLASRHDRGMAPERTERLGGEV
jgi:hypothetical protein